MTEDELVMQARRAATEKVGKAYFGPRWQTPLSTAIGYSTQHLGGVMSGKYQVSEDVMRKTIRWARKDGLPLLRQRYKDLYDGTNDLAFLEADARGEFEQNAEDVVDEPAPSLGMR